MNNPFPVLLRSLRIPLATLVAGLFHAGAASAATFTVDSLDDTPAADPATGPQDAKGRITLRSAIQHANTTAEADVIGFDTTLSYPATVSLSPALGHISITKPLLVEGPGADKLAISGQDQVQLFELRDLTRNPTPITFRSLSLTHGYTEINGGGFSITSPGNSIVLTLERCLVSDNQAAGPSGNGGGAISCLGGHVVLRNSTFTRNRSETAGGVIKYLSFGGSITFDQCTLSGNSSFFQGAVAASTDTRALLKISNSTLVENVAGAIASVVWEGPSQIRSTIIAGTGIKPDLFLPNFSSGGHNLFGTSLPGENLPLAASDILGVTLEQLALRELQTDGGGLPTRLPISASIAIDRGTCDNLEGIPLDTDQRLQPRFARLACDVGAVETPSECPTDNPSAIHADELGQALSRIKDLEQELAQLQAQLAQCRNDTIRQGVFYNRSIRDGNDPAANAADDQAIAPDKHALLPGETASFGNYTSYSRGLNGIMIDVHSLPGQLSASDFRFKVGNSSVPDQWNPAPLPTAVAVRNGQGGRGSDRITLVWPDNAIQKQWIEVTVLPTPNTGLLAPHTFYFGNAIGEVGNSSANAVVNSSDEIQIRANPRSLLNPAELHNPNDLNRDSQVNATDQLLCRRNQTSPLNALRMISPPTF